MPSLANLVPIPVTMATTRRPLSAPAWTVTPLTCVFLSDSFRARGQSSIGMAQMKATWPASVGASTRPVCRKALGAARSATGAREVTCTGAPIVGERRHRGRYEGWRARLMASARWRLGPGRAGGLGLGTCDPARDEQDPQQLEAEEDPLVEPAGLVAVSRGRPEKQEGADTEDRHDEQRPGYRPPTGNVAKLQGDQYGADRHGHERDEREREMHDARSVQVRALDVVGEERQEARPGRPHDDQAGSPSPPRDRTLDGRRAVGRARRRPRARRRHGAGS